LVPGPIPVIVPGSAQATVANVPPNAMGYEYTYTVGTIVIKDNPKIIVGN